MRAIKFLFLLLLLYVGACQSTSDSEQSANETEVQAEDNFVWRTETFADKQIIRYKVHGFDSLDLEQKKLVYYLTQAGLAGRDIIWDMNYRHNLDIRRALENIARTYEGDKNAEDWNKFMVYLKNVWFSNGIHHHYSADKFTPKFLRDYFEKLLETTNTTIDPKLVDVIFDPEIDSKKINLDSEKGLIKGSAVNFYDPGITESEVDAFYKKMKKPNDETPVSYGLNSKLVKGEDGQIREAVWKVDGMYGPAIAEIVKWLEKAVEVAENDAQRKALELLVKYYRTGDLEVWDEYNIAWVNATEGDIDYINGFIEVYNDPKGYKGSYESIIQIKDFEASVRMQTVAANAQWFEDNSPLLEEHKKKNVVGISYNIVNVAGEAGDASPSTPIGVNLPNANWIRTRHGSKSVSLGNIIEGYNNANGPGLLEEFAHDEEEVERGEQYGALAGKLHTALHEVIGHASGQLEPGMGTPSETLKNYRSPLEEARADLVSLYFILDPKLVELGLMPSLEVGKAEYDTYIRSGLMVQLRRIEPGKKIEQAHMRNRQLVAAWAFERGQEENVISRVEHDGKTYFEINDYEKLREIFGELLREVQRIKSQGDYEAGRDLVEGYGVQVDQSIHQEVLVRSEELNIPPYGGFINPRLVPELNENGDITNIKVEYPTDFATQMLEYSEKYSFLK